MKKKPLFTVPSAHPGTDNGTSVGENWVSAVAAHTYTDLVASGEWLRWGKLCNVVAVDLFLRGMV